MLSAPKIGQINKIHIEIISLIVCKFYFPSLGLAFISCFVYFSGIVKRKIMVLDLDETLVHSHTDG